ncbi:MAG: competence/damage-inducible protein A [Candidatus Thermoplasmatota archaeon]|nr:competence/damage-inducible protein A [Candidatus Thermoplasmatota archaeon]
MQAPGTGPVKAGSLVVGNEILLGRTVDTNTVFLAENLLGKGIRLRRWVMVPDESGMICKELGIFMEDDYDLVVVSGGMGPTHDDITVEAVAKAISVPLVFHDGCFGRMMEKWRSRNPGKTLPDSSKKGLEKMALVPRDLEPIINENGMVEGLAGSVNDGRMMIFILPGVPREYRGLVCSEEFQGRLPSGHEKDVHIREVHFHGKESQMALFLSDLQKRFPEIDIGSYPQGPNSVIIRVTGYPDRVGPAADIVQEEVDRLHRSFPEGG